MDTLVSVPSIPFLVPADWDPLEGSWASSWRLPLPSLVALRARGSGEPEPRSQGTQATAMAGFWGHAPAAGAFVQSVQDQKALSDRTSFQGSS